MTWLHPVLVSVYRVIPNFYRFDWPLAFLPVQPAAVVYADLLPARVLREPSGCLRPDAGLAVEDQLLFLRRPGEPVHLLKVFVRDVKGLYCCRNGDVYGAWNLAGLEQLWRLTNVCVTIAR